MWQEAASPPTDSGVTSSLSSTANSVVVGHDSDSSDRVGGGYDSDDLMDNLMVDLFEEFIEEDEVLDRIEARIVAPLLPHADPALRRRVLEQREQEPAQREEFRRGVARSRARTRKTRRLMRMVKTDVSGYSAARREAHEKETRRLAREIFVFDVSGEPDFVEDGLEVFAEQQEEKYFSEEGDLED